MSKQDARIMVSSDLTKDTLPKYIEALGITDDQIISITEPKPGEFTLIFRSTAEQQQAHEDWLAARAARMKEVIENGYGVYGSQGFRPIFTTAKAGRRR
jgi:hypothetical protein